MNARRKPVLLALLACLLLTGCDLNTAPSPSPAPAPSPTAAPILPTSTTEVSPTSAASPTTSGDRAATLTPLSASGEYKTLPGCPAQESGLGSVGDPFYPLTGNSGYDAQQYDLNLSVDVDRNTISGTTTIQARALQDLSLFHLDFQGMSISGLTVNDAPAESSRDGQELAITPAQPLRAGDTFTVSVSYSGTPEKPLDEAHSPAPGWVGFKGGIFVASEPVGSATWFPVNDHPCDKALYSMNITVPRPYVVAANGLLASTKDEGSQTTYEWRSRYPMASYLVTVNIAQFQVVTAKGPGGLPIRNFLPADLTAPARAAFDKTPQMIEYYSSLFGPYPFEAYGGVVVPLDLGFALETQTLSLFGQRVMVASGSEEGVLSHELSHQWFGDSVSLKEWKDIWLNEGFATYAQWLWADHSRGRGTLDQTVRQVYEDIRNPAYVPPGNVEADDLFNPGVYQRGGIILHALRMKTGDDAFFRILRTYADRYKYGNASTGDFIAAAQEISGQDLGDFFDGWLHSVIPPPIPEMGLKP